MVIFNSYVKLPEGFPISHFPNGFRIPWLPGGCAENRCTKPFLRLVQIPQDADVMEPPQDIDYVFEGCQGQVVMDRFPSDDNDNDDDGDDGGGGGGS
jgi:hypothetical protein